MISGGCGVAIGDPKGSDSGNMTPSQNLDRKIRALEIEIDALANIKVKIDNGGFAELTINEIQRELSAY